MFIDEIELQVDENITEFMKHHVSILDREISYFLELYDFHKYCRFIRKSSVLSINDLTTDDITIQKQLIYVVNDGGKNL